MLDGFLLTKYNVSLTNQTSHSLEISAMGPDTAEQASPNTITIVLLESTMSKKNFVATAMSHWKEKHSNIAMRYMSNTFKANYESSSHQCRS